MVGYIGNSGEGACLLQQKNYFLFFIFGQLSVFIVFTDLKFSGFVKSKFYYSFKSIVYIELLQYTLKNHVGTNTAFCGRNNWFVDISELR